MGEHASVNRVILAEGAGAEDLTCNVLLCTITHPVVCKPLVVHKASEHGSRDDRNFFVVFFLLLLLLFLIKRHILKQK